LNGKEIRLRALVASSDGKRVIRCDMKGDAADPQALGERVAQALRRQGADEILGR
jgi:hydroxymethylbilane synthase